MTVTTDTLVASARGGVAPAVVTMDRVFAAAVRRRLEAWDAADATTRLWNGDSTLWTSSDEGHWVGWLHIVDEQIAGLRALHDLRDEMRRESFAHTLLLGMGGSSLCPEVLAMTFGRQTGHPQFHVLDSTDPAQVASTAAQIDPARTLFIVSSKSGSTLEPNILYKYFFDVASAAVGGDRAAHQFIAITDPGSQLEAEARRVGFRSIWPGVPSIGGRYSALSNFGMVPAAVMGLDLDALLDNAARMTRACAPGSAASANPGVTLGAVLGELGAARVDKVTFIASPPIADLGAWLEQLLAESTGKNGRGVIPVDRERIGSPMVYGSDRLFCYLRLADEADPAQDAAVQALVVTGASVVRIELPSRAAIAGEFFRWEIATAVAGSILGINPFDQPDVEASKVATRALTAEYERTGHLADEEPLLVSDGLAIYADAANSAALRSRAGAPTSAAVALYAHLSRLTTDDYFALLAYVPMTAAHEALLQRTRLRVRDARRNATCVEFGPRFLHSTGQAYKGGPNSGVFIQVTCAHDTDVPVPGHAYTFGVVQAAQARGDLQVLWQRGRRAIRVHIGPDIAAGLQALDTAVATALYG